MPSLEAVLRTARKRVTPSQAEQRAIEQLIRQVEAAADRVCRAKGVRHTLAGSFLRDTWMPHKKEFDLFLLFPETVSREKLEKDGLMIAKKIVRLLHGKTAIAYAEHPYVRARIRGFAVDIVPCYAVKSAEHIRSAVDRTPFHNKWLAESLPAGAASEVRLAKQFLKNNGLYGSDNKTLGFSGYLCELLIVHYGSFRKLLEAAASWKPGTCIDIEGHSPPSQHQWSDHPFIVIDPVDRRRNVAAVLSNGNFVKWTRLCRQFLQKPSPDAFFKEPAPDIRLVKGKEFLVLSFPRPAVVDDTLWPQLRKAAGRLAGLLREADFQTRGTFVWADDLPPGKKPSRQKCWIVLDCLLSPLPPLRVVRGPPVEAAQHAQEFRRKYKEVSVRDGRLWAEAPRPFLEPQPLLKAFLKQSQKALREKGVPSAVPLKKTVFLRPEKLLPSLRKNRQFGRAFGEWMKEGGI